MTAAAGRGRRGGHVGGLRAMSPGAGKTSDRKPKP